MWLLYVHTLCMYIIGISIVQIHNRLKGSNHVHEVAGLEDGQESKESKMSDTITIK